LSLVVTHGIGDGKWGIGDYGEGVKS
jgi:hypothetical protein